MMIRKLNILLFVAGLFGSGVMLTAQQNQTQYFMNFPQANLLNPAFRPTSNVYISLPIISNTYISINNNMLSLSEMFQKVPGSDSIMTIFHPEYDRDEFLKKLGKTGYLSTEINFQMLGFGFSVDNDWYIDLSLTERVSASVYVPTDLFTLLLEGNEGFVGSSIDLTGLGFEAMQYLESGIGISKNITDKLRVGGRMKILFGGGNIELQNDRLEIEVNDDYSHTLNADMSLNISGPFSFYTNEDNLIDSIAVGEDISDIDLAMSFLTGNKNRGMAFDIGAEYKLFDNLSLSASIVDLGFIKWKNQTFNLEANSNFSFDGFDVSNVIDGDETFDEMMENFLDSLKNSFDFTDNSDSYNTALPAKLYLGAMYKPVNFLGLGLLSRTTFYHGHIGQALTLSANLYAGEVLSTTFSYTMANRSYNNFGAGMAARFGPVQIYSVFDNIPVSWVKFSGSDEGLNVIAPDRLDYFNVRFGINLVFGKVKQKATDKPMLLE